MSLLSVSGLTIAFGGAPVVDGVSFKVAAGERFGIIGESGSGKSLTAFSIAGLLPEGARRGGDILFEGKPLPTNEKIMARLRGQRIGMVFQEPMTALNPLMKAGAQIAEAVLLNRRDVDARNETLRLLAEVGLEARHASRYPHELSGGQRQRVMIAMALASEPELLIADEPTSALDLITQRTILDLIAEICERRQMALIFISHDLKAVAALCSQVLVLRRGQVVESGPASVVFSTPRQEYTRQLVAATRPVLRGLARAPLGGNLLVTHELTRKFRQPGANWFAPGAKFTAVDAISLSVREAESVAIVGPSGCGKSTLARMIVGLDRASSGDMDFAGRRHNGGNLPAEIRRDVSLVFQDPFGSFDPRLTIGQSVGEPLHLTKGLSPLEKFTAVSEAVEAVGLGRDLLDRYPHEFSGGQRQRFAIARALVTKPRLVVLDEPVSALDVSVRGEVLALLNRLRADHGLTFIIISHDLDMVRAVADRVLVMEAGRIVESGRPGDLFDNPQARLTRELIAARLPDVA